jgi:two-component system sensor histidine kinase LytS
VIEPDSDTLDNASARLLHRYVFVVAPLSYKNKVIGTLILAEKKKWLTAEAQVGFLDGLALLFSTQLELSQLDYHERLRKKAEFQMLQTQVNPHFLFNCLNTISYFCVEKPIRARELLLTLSQYYRYAIQNNSFFVELSDELRHITTYLELEKARFEERLILELEISQVPAVGCLVPSLILQPIIENAVHHGRDAKGNRFVSLTALPKNNGMEVIITDKGPGFPQEVLETFYAGEPTEDAVGLMNVHKRLLSLYGPEYGVKVLSSPQGTGITMFFPILSPEEVKELEVLACLS